MLLTPDNLQKILQFMLDQIGAVFDICWENGGMLGIGLISIPLIGRVFSIIKKLISR